MRYDPQTLICDLDGSVYNIEHRQVWLQPPNKKNWKAFYENLENDKPIYPVINMVNALHFQGYKILFCSGRPESHRDISLKCLNRDLGFKVSDHSLYMRTTGDYRDDTIIKLELLDKMRENGHYPSMAIDDRSKVCAAWVSANIFVFDVSQGKGNF